MPPPVYDSGSLRATLKLSVVASVCIFSPLCLSALYRIKKRSSTRTSRSSRTEKTSRSSGSNRSSRAREMLASPETSLTGTSSVG
jgi:hypothetical protein